jgi:hypothetical protein
MTTDEKADWSLIDFAKQLAGIHQTTLVDFDPTDPAPDSGALASAQETTNEAGTDSDYSRPISLEQDTPPADLQNAHPSQVIVPATFARKQIKTPDEIATIIMVALRSIDGCPDRGFIVTVYGSNPWNAMLTIRPEAGRSIDRGLWLSRAQEIGVRLREDFDVIQEPTAVAGGIGPEFADLGGRGRPSHEAEST